MDEQGNSIIIIISSSSNSSSSSTAGPLHRWMSRSGFGGGQLLNAALFSWSSYLELSICNLQRCNPTRERLGYVQVQEPLMLSMGRHSTHKVI